MTVDSYKINRSHRRCLLPLYFEKIFLFSTLTSSGNLDDTVIDDFFSPETRLYFTTIALRTVFYFDILSDHFNCLLSLIRLRHHPYHSVNIEPHF